MALRSDPVPKHTLITRRKPQLGEDSQGTGPRLRWDLAYKNWGPGTLVHTGFLGENLVSSVQGDCASRYRGNVGSKVIYWRGQKSKGQRSKACRGFGGQYHHGREHQAHGATVLPLEEQIARGGSDQRRSLDGLGTYTIECS